MLEVPDLTDADRKAQDACPHDATHDEPREFRSGGCFLRDGEYESHVWSETVTVCDDCSAEWIRFPSERIEIDGP